ncbi:MAG: DUF4297 domain-containing protein [Devosia sp.]|uniref:dsDNA nuclease domain-containing protein n=1 Tax=Devosia sp. TaxID=1871048 RepID=UPI001A4297B8|nr:dsDNA nuclease domain-containing protein [Devosia sp.]MBL8597788.1 DUF4297 domain-containing protein [Devosia sp.]
MSIRDTLLTVPQREDGGRTAYDRFEYQTAWGISKLLDLHIAGKNYAVGFEFQDDIISLDDAHSPSKAVFYQVKTKETGDWSFAKITARTSSKGVKKSSFAGRMFDHVLRFGAVVEKLVFVSNQCMPEVIVVHGECEFSIADKKKIETFVANLVAENGAFKDPDHTSLFFFAFSDLNLSNYDHAILGRITDFLDQEVGSHVPPKAFALALRQECRQRSRSLADVSSFEGLTSSKFVTRDDMLNWLAQAKDRHDRRPEWGWVSVELDLPYAEKVRIERAWRDYEVELLQRWNASTIAMTQKLRLLIDAAVPEADSLVAIVYASFAAAKLVVRTWKKDASDDFIKAAILYEHKR